MGCLTCLLADIESMDKEDRDTILETLQLDIDIFLMQMSEEKAIAFRSKRLKNQCDCTDRVMLAGFGLKLKEKEV